MNTNLLTAATITLIAIASGSSIAGDTTTVTFDNGTEGWTGPSGFGGATTIDPAGGNPGAHMQTIFNDFGITFRSSSNEAFVGDYTQFESITISIDVQVDFLSFPPIDVSRPFLLDLRDVDTATGGFPWSSVWFLFDHISEENNSEWTTYSVTFDPNSIEIPARWGGFGAEDPDTFEPTLPEGVTFAQVLSGVDTIAFTTLQPGWVFGFTDYEVGIDNITITRTLTSCPVDLNDDGELNFFDVSAFLNAFTAQDPAADFTGDGQYNFFDVSDFLNAFTAGCP